MSLTPLRPSTLAISCGSMKMAVVPCGTTVSLYCETLSMLLSTWIWPSMKPGQR